MAKTITLEQLQEQLTTTLDETLADGRRKSKHNIIRALLEAKASNAMALKICQARWPEGKPKVRMADIRWNRNRAMEDPALQMLDHEEADAHELELAGENLAPAAPSRPKALAGPPPVVTIRVHKGNPPPEVRVDGGDVWVRFTEE